MMKKILLLIAFSLISSKAMANRWIVYTATGGVIDCSGFANGGKLTNNAGGTTQCADDVSGGSSGLPLLPGDTNYAQNRNTLQSGATIYTSSGTINTFNALTIGISTSVPVTALSVVGGITTTSSMTTGGVMKSGSINNTGQTQFGYTSVSTTAVMSSTTFEELTAASSVTVSLPILSNAVSGMFAVIKNSSSSLTTVVTQSGQKIDGSTYTFLSPMGAGIFMSDASSAWKTVGKYKPTQYWNATTTVTLSALQDFVEFTTNPVIAYLPRAADNQNKEYFILNASTNPQILAVNNASGDLINGSTSYTLWNKWNNVHLISDGIRWRIFNQGDVSGPASVTKFDVPRYGDTTGKLLRDSSVSIDDTGNISLPSGSFTGIDSTHARISYNNSGSHGGQMNVYNDLVVVSYESINSGSVPNYPLDVTGEAAITTSGNGLKLSNGSYGGNTYNILGNAGTIYPYVIDPSGNGGNIIGNNSAYFPGTMLGVFGDIWFSGVLNASGTPGISVAPCGGTQVTSITITAGIVTACTGF